MKRLIMIICISILWLPMQVITLMAQDDIQLDIESKVGYVYNLDTDTAIYEKNADSKIYPASMTKIMTVYTALQYIKDMNHKITLNEIVFNDLIKENASVAGFSVNDEASIKDLLYGIMLPSGADACRAIAIYIAGSEQGFVELMNKQVIKLGLKHTHFTNTTGLHDNGHFTTAKEMAIILKEAIKNKNFLEIFTTKTYQTKALKSNQKGILMQSTMWKYLDTIHGDTSLFAGGKTGYTLEAGHCLASLSAKINQAQYITIIAQGKGTFQDMVHVKDTQKIYKYLKENYEYRSLYKKGEHLIDIPVKFLVVFMIGFIAYYFIGNQNNKTIKNQDANIDIVLKNDDVHLTRGCFYQSRYNIKSVKSEKGEELYYRKDLSENSYTIYDEINCNVAGTYEVKVVAMNNDGQTVEKTFHVTIHDDEIDYLEKDVEEVKPTYIDGVLLVNKQHALPSDYYDDNEIALQAYNKLYEAAIQAGYSLPLLSGYRSYEYQNELYQTYVNNDGVEAADRYSARAGYSEHQSGLCFDVGEISYEYGESEEGKWLAQHCAEYGFIIRYPKEKEHITGYMYEPWHIRYVGKDIATFIMKENITLEEYLGAR